MDTIENTAQITAPARGLIALPRTDRRARPRRRRRRRHHRQHLHVVDLHGHLPRDLTYYGSPAGLQILDLVAGALTLLFALTLFGVRGLRWANPAGATAPVVLAAGSAFAVSWFSAIAIAVDLKGLIALDPARHVTAIGSLIALVVPSLSRAPATPSRTGSASRATSPRPRSSPAGPSASSSPAPPPSP